MTLTELAGRLDVLRAAGVKNFFEDTEGLRVEFFLPIQTHAQTDVNPKSLAQALSDIEATDRCKCGHTEAAHNPEGECLQGCELEVCYPGNEPPPKPEANSEG